MGGLRPDRCHSPMAVQLRSVSVTVTLASIEWAELVATRNHFRNVATGAVSVAPFRSSQSRSLGSGVETCARGESQGNLSDSIAPTHPPWTSSTGGRDVLDRRCIPRLQKYRADGNAGL